jgi:hypothetical protein
MTVRHKYTAISISWRIRRQAREAPRRTGSVIRHTQYFAERHDIAQTVPYHNWGDHVQVASPDRPPLSTSRAFVVQFRDETDVEMGRFMGRVEHVISGNATHFASLQELLTFIGRVLGALRDAPPQES